MKIFAGTHLSSHKVWIGRLQRKCCSVSCQRSTDTLPGIDSAAAGVTKPLITSRRELFSSLRAVGDFSCRSQSKWITWLWMLIQTRLNEIKKTTSVQCIWCRLDVYPSITELWKLCRNEREAVRAKFFHSFYCFIPNPWGQYHSDSKQQFVCRSCLLGCVCWWHRLQQEARD